RACDRDVPDRTRSSSDAAVDRSIPPAWRQHLPPGLPPPVPSHACVSRCAHDRESLTTERWIYICIQSE
ncbi:hypothetical protein PENTCL1PPCAC_3338, partial [Pristionchus entomophagus]